MKAEPHARPLLPGIMVASLLAGLAGGVLAYLLLNLPLTYRDLIAGDAGWRAVGKIRDIAAMFGFVGGFALTAYGLLRWHRGFMAREQVAYGDALEGLLRLLWIPLALWAGLQAFSATPPSFTLPLLSFLAAMPMLLVFALAARRGVLAENARALGATAWGAALLSVAAILLPLFLRSRLGLPMGWSIGLAACIALLLALGWSLGLARWRHELDRPLRALLIAAQGITAFYLLALFPNPWVMAGEPYRFATTPLLTLLIAGLIACAWADLARRWRNASRGAALSGLFSPLCLAANLAAWIVPLLPPPMIFGDDYHHGEHLLPLFMWLEHHALPYVDYAPAHGFADDMASAVGAKLFLTDQAPHYYAAGQIVRGFLRIGLVCAAMPVLGLPLGLLVGLLSAGLQPWSMLALTTLFLLWRMRAHVAMPVFALLGGYGLFLGWPGLGAAFLLALAPMLTLFAFTSGQWKTALRVALATGAAILFLWLLFPDLVRMTFGALRYVLENGAINLAAYGVPWSASWVGSAQKANGALFEAVRFSWLLLPCLFIWLCVRGGKAAIRAQKEPFLLLGFGTLLLLLMTSYALGRIDPGYLFRLGLCAMIALVLIGWAAHYWLTTPAARTGLYTVLALWVGLFGALPQDPAAQLWQGFREQREGAPLTDFSAHGLPRLGKGVAEQAHLARIKAVKGIVDRVADEGETFLDLTNRSALYYYLGRPMPLEAAPYNQPSSAMQARSVARLEKNPPPLALLKAEGLQHDGRSASIRAYQLYRFALNHYVPVKIGELIVGIRPDRLDRLPPEWKTRVPTSGNAKLLLWDEVFRLAEFDRLPIAWGRSWATLESRLTPLPDMILGPPKLRDLEETAPRRYRIAGPAPAITFRIRDDHAQGKYSGLFGFTFACEKSRARPVFQFSWVDHGWLDPKGEGNVRFQGEVGTLLVPLDVLPRWKLGWPIDSATLTLVDSGGCGEFAIERPSFYQREGGDKVTDEPEATDKDKDLEF